MREASQRKGSGGGGDSAWKAEKAIQRRQRDKGGTRKRRGVEGGRDRRNIYCGSFPSGEELVGFGNREGLHEPTDIVIQSVQRRREFLDRDGMGRVFIRATWWEMGTQQGHWRSPGTLWPFPEMGR